MSDIAKPQEGRRLDLDWIRIGAFALLILYHIGMFYVPWPWHVKSRAPVEWLQPIMALVNPWRLTLLFVVSGAASRFMLDKLGPAQFARIRAPRLLIPVLFGMLVVVPPQTWAQVAQIPGTKLPAVAFYLAYLTGAGGWAIDGVPLTTPTWNHLWFVVYLLAYTLVLAAGCAAWRQIPRLCDSIARMGANLAGILVPALWFVGVRTLLQSRYPETHAFVGDWTVHAQSAFAFVLGYAVAKQGDWWSALEQRRWLLLGLALAALTSYAGTLALLIAGMVPGGPALVIMSWSFGFAQWLPVAAILAFGSVHLRGVDRPVRSYLTHAVFPFYIVHQTIIIWVAHALRPRSLWLPIEAALILIATIIGCIATYEIARRVKILRPLFGLRL